MKITKEQRNLIQVNLYIRNMRRFNQENQLNRPGAPSSSNHLNKHPLIIYQDNLALKVMDDRLKSIYGLIQSNPEVSRQ